MVKHWSKGLTDGNGLLSTVAQVDTVGNAAGERGQSVDGRQERTEASYDMLKLILLGVIAVASAGCGDGGPKKYPVSGTVTYEGEPPMGVDSLITFIDTNMQYDGDVGKLDAQGKYAFKSTAGKKRVEIRCTKDTKDKNDEGMAYRENFIPEHYNRESILEVTVEPDGKNVFDFPLQAKKPNSR